MNKTQSKFGTGNVAREKKAVLSALPEIYSDSSWSDNTLNTYFEIDMNGTTVSPEVKGSAAWWQVDLAEFYAVSYINIFTTNSSMYADTLYSYVVLCLH